MPSPDNTHSDNRKLVYFVSDVHLGLQVGNPADREARFVDFLKKIPAEKTRALYMLGDIWDFWYEWKYTVPKGYVRVFSALMDLMEKGVEIYFFQGNHDIWCYSWFEELGMHRLEQPSFVEIGDKTFCLGHGDALGPTSLGYRIMRGIFHNKAAQWAFSTFVHPTAAMALGNAWSRRGRLKRAPYVWKGQKEPLYEFSQKILESRKVDYFIFGHFHVDVHEAVVTSPASGITRSASLTVLNSWLDEDSFFVYEMQ